MFELGIWWFVENTPDAITGSKDLLEEIELADPVRIFQEFTTLDLISNGRAEIIAGRGSSRLFPLFAEDPHDHGELFSKELE